MRLLLLLPTLLIVSLYFTISTAFSSECISSIATRLSTSMETSLSASVSRAQNDSETGDSSDITAPKISYRTAKLEDVSAISGLLNSVFEDDDGEEQVDADDTTTTSEDNDTDDNTFLWDSLQEKSSEPQLSPERQLVLIAEKLAERMVDAKKEESLPHLFLVATIPSSPEKETSSEQDEDRVVGFLEMGTLPPPNRIHPLGKLNCHI